MRAIGALAVGLALVVPLGCSRKSDNDSLREGLSRMPESAAPVDSPDSASLTPSLADRTAALPDTAGLPTTPDVAQDTSRGGLQPVARDTHPWIPTPRGIAPAGWTTEPSETRNSGRPVLLTAVRAARNADFDRVVFQFDGAQPPGYRIEYLNGAARQCGSGARVPVAGNARLEVRLSPSVMHSDEGAPTVPRSIRTDLPALPELRLTCDFEGQVAWVLGLDRVRPYRVTSLVNPARLVVDLGR